MLLKRFAALAPMLAVAMVALRLPAVASQTSLDFGGTDEAVVLADVSRHLLSASKCPASYTSCPGGLCINLLWDTDNCGSCGNVCPSNHQCTSRVCKPVATGGPMVATFSSKTTKCHAPPKKNTPPTFCYYDTKHSSNNCGRCGVRCPEGSYCWNGQCVCLPTYCPCKDHWGKLRKCIAPGQKCADGTPCCPAGWKRCTTRPSGCCPPCDDPKGFPDGLCYTPRGPVCCPKSQPGTNCHGPRNNRQCCPTDKWTGGTTQTCCPADKEPVPCEAANGDPSPPTLCCDPGLDCKFNQNPGPNGKVLGYVCTAATCPPIDKCLDATDALTDPPCCCKKCTAPFVPMCPAVDSKGTLNKTCNEPRGSGCGCKCPPNLLIGTQCCTTKVCGTICCPRGDDMCYTDTSSAKKALKPAAVELCCPIAKWDAINKVCCKVDLCETRRGKVCCPSGSKCQSRPGANNDVCCPDANWTGTTCCPNAACATRSGKVCCPSGSKCQIVAGANNDVCCPDSLWTGSTCCPVDKTPVQCEARPGGNFPPPPKICCDPDIDCKWNPNPDPVTKKPIGYACISQFCPPPASIDPRCTETTSEVTDPPCCCKQCSGGFVPQCTPLRASCNEAGGSGCGCKCPSGKVCSGTRCCPKADDACYTVNGQPACCPKERWTGTACCPPNQKYCVAAGKCIDKDVCCTEADCPCPVPTGPAARTACAECCQQFLCCEVNGQRQCLQPDDSNCAFCGDKCEEGEMCALNECVPLPEL